MAKKKRKLPHIRLKLVTWIALWLMAFLLPLAWMRISQPEQTEAAWWNDAWHYRQRVDVTNNTSEEANVYIALILDTSDTTKFQANCGDLRFTKQNGQLLQYYLVSGCGTASTSIHVQFDTFPAGAQSVYAYYGNAATPDGFASADFSTEASNYTIGGVASEEVGPGPVAYWKFDEGSGPVVYDSATYSMSSELLADGDMEAADTTDWAAITSTLSKETSDPHSGSNSLRVSNPAAPTHAWARQTIVATGKRYRVSGYAKSDGVNTPLVYSGGVRWTGTTATSWQAFDVEYTMPAGTTISFGAYNMTTGGYVEFDDVSVREIGSVNQGTISGATWASEDQCVSGKCLSFDGVDDYVDMNSAVFSGTGAISFSVWFKTDDTRSINNTILGGGASGNGQSLEFNIEDGVLWTRNWYNTANGGTGYNDGQWHHLVWTKEENVSVSGWKAYIDGYSINLSTTGSDLLNFGGLNTLIGKSQQASSRTFNGYLDEPKIFPYALSEDQIKTEYNLGSATIVGEAATVAPPPNGTLKDSLVAHWSFDEQAGQTVHDKVGGNDGTRGADANAGSDDPTWKPANECKVNGCASFDGAGDYVAIADDSALKPNTLSISGWIKLNVNLASQPASFPIFIDKYSLSPMTGYRILFERNQDKLSFSVMDGTTIYQASLTSAGSTLGTDWHHVSAVFDGSNVKLYVDGVLKATAAANTTIDFGNETLYIGSYDGSQHFLQGVIDEVKIYNTALTADQVKQDMNAGAAIVYGVTANEADELSDGAGDPPIAEWRFDEKQGATAYDTSGNENNGTVNGATWKSACKQGACLEFDGVDDYVDGFNTPTMQNFSVSVWVKHAGGNDDIILGSTHSRWLKLFFVSPTQIRLWSYDGADNYYTWDVPDLTNQWRHLELIYDSNTGYTTLYHNGDNIGSKTITASSIQVPFKFIGAQVSGSTAYSPFNGQIDHVKIYDYARTPAQIAYDYNRGKPIAHWKFDECDGTVAHDSSGNDNHGTINIGASGSQTTAGTCSTSGAWGNGASGKFNGSLNFDGTDDYIDIGDKSNLDFGTNDFSISTWVKQDSTDSNYVVLRKGNYASDGYVLRITGLGVVGFHTYDATTARTLQSSGDEMTAHIGQWTHISVSVDRDGDKKIYVNGRSVPTAPTAVASGSITSSGKNFQIGGPYTTGNHYFQGQIDDVRIYNYALSPAQVQKVMNEGMAVRYGPATRAQ